VINRSTYEEFFLLYIDGELSAADKQAVELFVQEHADLADELALYQQMRLPAEELAFTDKTVLYRFEAEDINAGNYEEYFLLYVDNELDAVTKEKVEVFVLQHPAYQEQFTLLKQTKLPLETLVFTDKQLLYRKEEKKPVVYLYWRRVAVAAVLIGLMVLAGNLLRDGDSSNQTLAGKTAIENAAGKTNNVADQGKQVIESNNNNKIAALSNTGNHSGRVVKNADVIETKQLSTTPDNLLAVNNNPVIPVETKPETNTTPVINATEEKTQTTERIVADNNSSSNTNMIKTVNPAEENMVSNPIAQTTAYKELDTDDEKKSLYLGSLEINKDKLRGLFRKASAIFRSKAKQEEDIKTEATPRNLK
jgi:anti-sigma factor RsiW